MFVMVNDSISGKVDLEYHSLSVAILSEYRQLCLIRTDVFPKFLSGLGKIRIMHIGIICIEGTGTFQSVRCRRKSGLHMSGLSRVACIRIMC